MDKIKLPEFKSENCLEEFKKEKYNETRCKIPLNSGFYGLKFDGDIINKNKKYKTCEINNNFDLDNCTTKPMPEYKDIKPIQYYNKSFKIGKYTIPFYYLLLDEKFNFISTFLTNEQEKIEIEQEKIEIEKNYLKLEQASLKLELAKPKNEQEKLTIKQYELNIKKYNLNIIKLNQQKKPYDLNVMFINNLFRTIYTSSDDIKSYSIVGISLIGSTINKYIFINKFKFIMEILYYDYNILYSKNDPFENPYNDPTKIQSIHKNIDDNNIAGIVDFIFSNENCILKSDDVYCEYYNKMKRKVQYIKQQLESIFCETDNVKLCEIDSEKLNLPNLITLNDLQTNIINSTKSNFENSMEKNILKITNMEKNNTVIFKNEITEILYMITTIENNNDYKYNDIPFTLLILLTYFYNRVFIKPVLTYNNFESFPINSMKAINKLNLEDYKSQNISNFKEFFFNNLPTIYPYNVLRKPDLSSYPDCVETVIFNLVKLFYWNEKERKYIFPSEETHFVKVFKDSLGKPNEYMEYSNKIGHFIWDKEDYGFIYKDNNPKYELKSDFKNILLAIYYILIIKENFSEISPELKEEIKSYNIDKLLEKINNIIKIIEYNLKYSIDTKLNKIILNLIMIDNNIVITIIPGHSSIKQKSKIDNDDLISIYEELTKNMKNIIKYIDINSIIDIIILDNYKLSSRILKDCDPKIFNLQFKINNRNSSLLYQVLYQAPNGGISDELIKFIIQNTNTETINKSNDGYYILNEALNKTYSFEIINILFNRGAIVNCDIELYPSIFYAAALIEFYPEVFDLILKKSPPNIINYINKNGETILYAAIKTNNIDIVTKILELIDTTIINNIDIDGNTALHLALMNNEIEKNIIKLLTPRMTNINIRNNNNKTPLDLAKENNIKIQNFLKGAIEKLLGGNFYNLSNYIKNKVNKYYYKNNIFSI
jgi:hypothetical protein